MRMTELLNIIENNGKGVRAYSECGRAARECIKTQSDQATAYYLLSIAADRFVETYDDQPLLSQGAEDAYLNFKSYVEQLAETEQENDAAKKLQTLNRVAAEIADDRFLKSAG
ncbi:MAG: hypothetical protein ACSHYC_11280 [Alphaproteobacteria bacterium]